MSKVFKACTKRIYFGPPGKEKSLYWTVKVRNAKKAVRINGSVADALAGISGVTIGCALENTVRANPNAFPHPVLLGAVTKRTALIVDSRNADGTPKTAVLYEHNHGRFVDLNDTGDLKKMVKENPKLMERQFMLLPPAKRKPLGISRNSGVKKPHDGNGAVIVPRGALRRAQKAGLVGEHMASALTGLVK